MSRHLRPPFRRVRPQLAGLAAVSLVLAACGGDDSSDLSALELRTICRDGAALHSAAAAEDRDGIDRALEDLDDADVESRTDLDLGSLMADADDGDLAAIVAAFEDVGCDPDDVAVTPTVPDTTVPPTTAPPTTAPETTVPDTTEPPTTEPAPTTEPPTTEPDDGTDDGEAAAAAGIITVDLDSAPLPAEAAVNELLDAPAVDVLAAYGVDGMIAPSGPEARVFDMSLIVGRSINEAGQQRRNDTVTFLVDSAEEPEAILGRFRSTVEGLGDYSFRETTSQSDGVATISFDADVDTFDPTVDRWSVGVSTLDDIALQLITVRRNIDVTDAGFPALPGPVDEQLGAQIAVGDGLGWSLTGYDASVGVNQFNGQPFNRYSLTLTTEMTDVDEAADSLLATLDGSEPAESVSSDSRTVVDADGGRWLMIQTLDDLIQVTYTPQLR